jgi:hypothetical protein
MANKKIIKSPFLIVEEFISPKLCEQIIDNIRVEQCDLDKDGDPVPMERQHEELQIVIFNKFKEYIPKIEEKYDAKYKGTNSITFQYFPELAKKPAQQPGCENSKYLRKKWVKIKDVDLTSVLWLKNYQDRTPLDPRTEVYGGKIEFPAYNFSLVPQRGTLVIFPAGPHFITTISPILVSDLYQVKINISIENKNGGIWLYQPANFPGSWQQWFEGYF